MESIVHNEGNLVMTAGAMLVLVIIVVGVLYYMGVIHTNTVTVLKPVLIPKTVVVDGYASLNWWSSAGAAPVAIRFDGQKVYLDNNMHFSIPLQNNQTYNVTIVWESKIPFVPGGVCYAEMYPLDEINNTLVDRNFTCQ